MVGVERFELPTLWSQTRCATRLRYTPCRDWQREYTVHFASQPINPAVAADFSPDLWTQHENLERPFVFSAGRNSAWVLDRP